MSNRAVVVAGLLAILVLTGSGWAQAGAAPGMITGAITYRERMALPADAAIDVRLEDVSVQGAPAKLMAENVFAAAGKQVPISFQLPYNPADINSSHTYYLRANISVNGQMTFTSSTAYPVLTNGAPSQVNVMLQQVQATAAKPTGKKLLGTRWLLTQLNGKPAIPGMGDKAAYLVLHREQYRVSGSGGCNTLSGSYVLEQNALQITPGAATMMACSPEVMQQEQNFIEALGATTTYRINGTTLELLKGTQVLAAFQAQKKVAAF